MKAPPERFTAGFFRPSLGASLRGFGGNLAHHLECDWWTSATDGGHGFLPSRALRVHLGD